MQATIELNGLCKRFGQTVALDGLSFTVAPGSVTGFVGPNGAGKSTTMQVRDRGLALVRRNRLVAGPRKEYGRRRPFSAAFCVNISRRPPAGMSWFTPLARVVSPQRRNAVYR
jgi:hypothetical protein